MNVAFIFPGQGSQSVGMLADARQVFSVVEETFREAADALGYDIGALIAEGPAERLALTEYTQPVILTASVALYRAWHSVGGVTPAYVAGHSLGEYSALVAAGVVSLADAVRLVRRRGEAMQAAVPVGVGAMAAIIGLDDDAIRTICDEVTAAGDGFVGAVNFNAPGQVVIAGEAGAVGRAVDALKAAGAKRALPLPVSAPFHTPLMAPAADVMREALTEVAFEAPVMPVLSNVTATGQTDPAQIRRLLIEQVASPVRWTDCMAWMFAQGCNTFVECGPGKVLSGLAKRIDANASAHPIESPEALHAAAKTLR